MDEWYEIGAHILCKTCLGTEITGILCAYDIDQKLIFLKRTAQQLQILQQASPLSIPSEAQQAGSSQVAGDEENNNTNATVTNSSKSPSSPKATEQTKSINNNIESNTTTSSSANSESQYTLVNLRFVSHIEEIDEESNTICDSSVNQDSSDNKLISLPAKLDIAKLKQRLSDNRSEKMRYAKLAALGVTRDGLELIKTMKKTLGSQRDNVKWDKQGNIIIFDEIKCCAPFKADNLSAINEHTANKQTLEHVRKIIAKFYVDKEEKESLNMMLAACKVAEQAKAAQAAAAAKEIGSGDLKMNGGV